MDTGLSKKSQTRQHTDCAPRLGEGLTQTQPVLLGSQVRRGATSGKPPPGVEMALILDGGGVTQSGRRCKKPSSCRLPMCLFLYLICTFREQNRCEVSLPAREFDWDRADKGIEKIKDGLGGVG